MNLLLKMKTVVNIRSNMKIIDTVGSGDGQQSKFSEFLLICSSFLSFLTSSPIHIGTKPNAVTRPTSIFTYYLGERDFAEVRVGMLG